MTVEAGNTRARFFSTLWIFATLNYLYADVVTLMDKSVVINLSQTSLLGASVLVETAIAMVLLSRILKYRASRWANIIVGGINTAAVLLSLLVGTPAPYYAFFAAIEVACTTVIVGYALKWRPEVQLVQ